MAGIYTVDQTLQVNDYYNKVVRAKRYDNIIQSIIKIGDRPINWKQEIEIEDAPGAYDIAAAEGQDFDESKLTGRTNGMVEVQVQKFRTQRGFKVTDETELFPGHTEAHGEKQYARQVRRDAEEAAFSIDCTLGSDQEAVARGTGKTGDDIARTRGIVCWLKKDGAHTVMPIPDYAKPHCGISGDIAELTEAQLKAELIKASLEAGDTNLQLVALVGLHLKAKMSNWLGTAEAVQNVTNILRRNEAKTRKIELICDEFQYDGVQFKALTCNHIGCSMPTKEGGAADVGGAIAIGNKQYYSGVFIRPEYWDRGVAKALTIKTLENRGGGKRGFHEAFLRLTCRNPLGQFAVLHTAS